MEIEQIEDEDQDESLETNENSSSFSLPRASVQRIVKDALGDFKITNETVDLITKCCVGDSNLFSYLISEFLQLVSSESNEICTKENKKSISPQHVVSALKRLGFDSYVKQVEDATSSHKTHVKENPKRKSKKLESLGIPTEQLLKEQQLLFAQARFVFFLLFEI